MSRNKGLLFGALYVILTFTAIISVTVVLPQVTFRPQPTPGLTPYTSLEQVGRKIYQREGCFYCHSQFSRLQDRGTGEPALPGNYVYDDPNLLGTARTGPDLSNIGGLFPDSWHKAHHSHPQRLNPGSIMPSFDYLNNMTTTYRDETGIKRTATDMDALIAYLQSLGHANRQKKFVVAPWEYRFGNENFRFHGKKLTENPVGSNPGSINGGRGIYLQNCAVCHGTTGEGNGPNALNMTKKPADFTRPFYKQYGDDFWYFRITEGVPGTQMPRWQYMLTEEQRWYLVNFLKTLPKGEDKKTKIVPQDYLDEAFAVGPEGNKKDKRGEIKP